MIHVNNILVILTLLFLLDSCQAQVGLVSVDKKDVEGVVFERCTIDTISQSLMTREYFFSPDSIIQLPTDSCTMPKMCYPDTVFSRLLEDRLIWPKNKNKEVLGDVILSLLISSKGNIADVKVLKGIAACASCSESALDFLKLLTCWYPAECSGEKQADIVYLKIPFRPYPANFR